jgi:hypothetical protein
MNKKQLGERDICTKFIAPALQAGCNEITQLGPNLRISNSVRT